ncbi:hypothetical protein JVT61DRAFT_9148 [Boletus reticuloceps]|uniref:C2H2-type domain-containing protein n=1 Tax=Boletus reticuloceps TaxID=495285 RepID=A0A8I3A6A9_9AGAM|nr:hypothetical protein JVT61DRAFT_9148 [Boletus reticuloceps]
MLLSIPVLDILHSQLDIELDIGVDPSNGTLTYNIKDIHSRLRQPHELQTTGTDLALTLQSSPQGSDPGTLSIRISPTQAALCDPNSMNVSEDTLYLSADQSEHSAHSMTAGTLIPAVYAQDSFGDGDSTNATYDHFVAGGQGSLDEIMHQSSLWASLQDNAPQRSDVPDLSPVSQTLSLISSGSITEDFDSYSQSGPYEFSDSQFNPTSIQLDHTRYLASSATHHCSQDPINSIMDIQVQPEGSYLDPASCGSFSIMDLFTPTSHSESSSQASSTAASPKCGQINLELYPSTHSPCHGVSIHEAYPTSFPSNGGKYSAEPGRGGKRNVFPCPFPSCGRVLKSMYTQRIHLKTHESRPQKHFPCTMGCPESFTRHHDRLRHEVAQHGKQCEFSCTQCERFFSSQRMLDRHTCWSWRNGSVRWQQKDTAPSEA